MEEGFVSFLGLEAEADSGWQNWAGKLVVLQWFPEHYRLTEYFLHTMVAC